MFKVVENVHFARNCLRCDDFVHLGHVARPVHLTLMIYLQLDLNALIFRQFGPTLCRSRLA